GTKGYIGTGENYNLASPLLQDFWEWNQANNTWTQKADFGGTGRSYATGFSIGAQGYIGTGMDNSSYRQDFWEWDQASDTWTQKTLFLGNARRSDVGFSIGSKGYIGTGFDNNNFLADFWEWDKD